MRSYDVATAALALQVDRKWLDNLIAHHDVVGVERFARGVSRRLSMRALVAAAIARDLQRELAVPAARAVEIATRALAHHHPDLPLAPALSLRIDHAALEREIAHHLVHAMETAAPRRRGRPPGHHRKRERGTP